MNVQHKKGSIAFLAHCRFVVQVHQVRLRSVFRALSLTTTALVLLIALKAFTCCQPWGCEGRSSIHRL